MTPRERAEQLYYQACPHGKKLWGNSSKFVMATRCTVCITQAIEDAVEEAEVQVRAKGRLLTAIEVAEKKEACAKVVEEFDFNYEVTVAQIAASIRNHK